MILNDHDVSDIEIGIESTSSVGDHQQFHSHQSHHSDGKDDLLHRVSLVKMESSSHAHTLNASNGSKNKLSHVSSDGCIGKSGDFRVLESFTVLKTFTQTRQARSADNSNLWSIFSIRQQEVSNNFIRVRHFHLLRLFEVVIYLQK